jgi:hypothetical protein
MSLSAAVLIAFLANFGCAEFGQVNQGQAVHFDRAAGVVTLISDSNYNDPANPRYDTLPPVTVRIPQDPNDMGPEPEAGWLLSLDTEAGKAVVYNPDSRSLRSIEIVPIERQSGVAPNSPLVAGKTFPIVDRQSKSVTVYSRSWRSLVRFTVADEHLNLPEAAWRVGDQVRYYYKSPDQALRFMNVSKTDLSPSK